MVTLISSDQLFENANHRDVCDSRFIPLFSIYKLLDLEKGREGRGRGGGGGGGCGAK